MLISRDTAAKVLNGSRGAGGVATWRGSPFKRAIASRRRSGDADIAADKKSLEIELDIVIPFS